MLGAKDMAVDTVDMSINCFLFFRGDLNNGRALIKSDD